MDGKYREDLDPNAQRTGADSGLSQKVGARLGPNLVDGAMRLRKKSVLVAVLLFLEPGNRKQKTENRKQNALPL